MPIHLLKLLNRKEVARDTVVFQFSKPPGFTFKPGQYGGFTLINPIEIERGTATKRFSLLSTPDDDDIAIVTRMQNSAYKHSLNALPLHKEIKFAGPTGNFILHEEKTIPAVFIAGGIGIAPFYSMIRYELKANTSQSLFLFYGNASPSQSAFIPELMQLAASHPNFHFVPTMDDAPTSWTGERGLITESMIRHYVADITSPIYYVCGSPAMVTAIQELLIEMGILENNIKVEDFPGY